MAHCTHEKTRQVMQGVRAVKWCTSCGAIYDGERWHRHAQHGTAKKRHVQRDAHKAARRVAARAPKPAPAKHPKKRSAKQIAATKRMLAAAKARREGAR